MVASERTHKSRISRNRVSQAVVRLQSDSPAVNYFISWLKGIGLGRIVRAGSRAVYHHPQLGLSEYMEARLILQHEYDYWLRRSPEVCALWKF